MQQRAFIIVIALAIAARLAFLFFFGNILDFTLPENDTHGSEAYDEYAINLLATGVYGRDAGIPDAAIPPLYSYVLAAVYGLFGRGYIQIGLFHSLLDVISIGLLYLICKKLFTNGGGVQSLRAAEWVGVLAGLFYALYPYLIFQNLTVIDTPFWILLLHAWVLLLILIRERESWDKWLWIYVILGGIVLGLSLLARPLMPPLAILAALWFLFRRSIWQTILRLAPVAIVGFLVVLPWIVRNYGLYNDFVPMTTTSGANFWQGNSKWVIPVFQAGYDVQWTAPDDESLDDMPVHEADAIRFEMAWDYLRSNPDSLPLLFWTKFTVHWNIAITPLHNPQFGERMEISDSGELLILPAASDIEGVTQANVSYDSGLMNTLGRPVHMLYFGGLLALAILGVILSLNQWREVSLLWFVQIAMTFVYMVFHPSTRYRSPSDPLLFAFSAYALVWIWQWWRNRGKDLSTENTKSAEG